MSITSIVRLWFESRTRTIARYTDDAEKIQRGVLNRLLRKGAETLYGTSNGLGRQFTYEDFASALPIANYDTLKDYIDRMRHGEKNVLWPGQTKWYAKSSGTTSDKSKFIPVTPDVLHRTHYAGGRDSVALYLHNHPDSRILDGKALILGGSHAPNYNLPGSLVGDLSAILIENINPLVNLLRVPDKHTALLPDFEEKREKIAQMAVRERRITNISGVPSWMMAVLTRMLEISGAERITDLWPRAEVFFHGGVAFTPYRAQYERLFGKGGLRYMETYNASEGFFGIQSDPSDPAMLLMIDYGVFYEFVPLEEVEKGEQARAVPLWQVETGRNYAMVITTEGGLWRYMIGDTVRFTQTRPYKFVITGRTKSFINAFGEELIVDNAENGLREACQATGAVVNEYTAAPVFMDAQGKCRHQWVVEFEKMPQGGVEHFAQLLDEALQRINSDYEAKRHKDITLQRLEIVAATPGTFNLWLKSRGKLGGQHKVPRLGNTRDIIEQVLAIVKETNKKEG